MKIGLAQFDFTVGDFQGNLKKILDVYETAQSQDLDLLAFPELALSGYIPEDLLLRDDFLLACQEALSQLTKKILDLPIIIGCPLQKEGVRYNAAVVLHQQKQIAYYAKQILPNYGVFDEKRYFTAGTEAGVFQLSSKHPKIALLICEDVWTTAPALRAKAAGAELLLSIHASPFAIGKEKEREKVYTAACQAAELPMLAVLTVGAQDDLCFDGGSRALNAKGECVTQAPFFKEALLVVEVEKITSPLVGEVDKAKLWRVRGNVKDTPHRLTPSASSLPLPQGERRDADVDIPHIYQALVLGIRDYVHKNHFKGALLGLSGGIDSALTLMLAIDALGVENVTPVSMPSRHTSTLSLEAIEEQLKLTGAKGLTFSIEDMFDASLHTLSSAFHGLPQDKTEENLQARCRGMLLMALSNKTGKIVLTTGNKSEMAMGYATLYGDMVGAFAALKDVYKTQVFQLARYRNTLQYQIPEVVITRPPSAELAPNQKDEDSLPPYEVLDEILSRYIDRQESIAHIVGAGFDEAMVKRVVKMLFQNEYKRRQAPPGIKITEVSFTRERRYPMTAGDWVNFLHLTRATSR